MAIDLLSIQPQKVSTDATSYTNLIYGGAKTGKSTFMNKLFGEEALFLMTEKRYSALEGARVQYVDNWSTFMQILAQVNKKDFMEQSGFKIVIIDSVENLADYLNNFVASKYQEEMVGEGKVGYGRDYVDRKETWKKALKLLEKSGLAINFVSHSVTNTVQVPVADISQEEGAQIQGASIEKDSKTGVEMVEFSRSEPSIPKWAYPIVNNMVDNILFLDMDSRGNRILHLRSTPQFEAGSTFTNVPDTIPATAEAYKETIANALTHYDNTTNDREARADIEESPLDYDQLISEATELGNKYAQADRMTELTDIIEGVAGPGAKLMNMRENQVELVDAIVAQLKESL